MIYEECWPCFVLGHRIHFTTHPALEERKKDDTVNDSQGKDCDIETCSGNVDDSQSEEVLPDLDIVVNTGDSYR